ncbi:glycoside hydrolase family 98 domain-containing protein [Paraflavisolibacter sp. H34]|uniref:glycoside hydrolase family 98 domain-containing protein n=1 Tax=Huijunlia imazamoxiresistens TaxID=3127457 RepID=UPI003017CF19
MKRTLRACHVLKVLLCLFLLAGTVAARAQTNRYLRRPTSPSSPMWIIHIDTWNYADPQKIIDMVPADIRPYVVFNISLSISHDATTGKWNQVEYGYETVKSWLRTCAENRVWAMVQQSSGGFQHFSDFDLGVYEELYREYPNLIGFNYAEQFWGYDDPFSVSWTQRMALFTNLLKLSNKYGGYLVVSWCGNQWSPNINPMAMMKRNPDFAAASRQYTQNFILCEKYTQQSYQSDMESLCLGAYLSGFSGQYGIRYDATGWTDATGVNANFTMATAGAPHLEHVMLTGETIIDGPETIPVEQSREISAGPATDGFTTRRWEFYPQFYNVTLDIFRKILDGTVRIPSRREVIDRTKVAIVHDVNTGSIDDMYSTPQTLFEGLYRMDGDGNLRDNKTFFKKSGRYPTVPVAFQLADADARSFAVQVNQSAYGSRWPNTAAKVAEFNSLFPQEYTGDLYAGRHENGWVVYNPYKTGQAASGRIPFQYNTCDSMELTFSQYTAGVVKETAHQLKFYLNNYDNVVNTGLKTDVIRIYGSSAEPAYTFTDRGNHQPSEVTKSWSGGVLTLTIRHNGALDLAVNCSGAATGRRTQYTTASLLAPGIPAAYTGPRQYEAEYFDYKSIAGNTTSGINSGVSSYTAQGFLRFGTNAAAGIRKTVTALQPGAYRLQTRYTAVGGDVTSVDLYVNGVQVATPVFSQTATTSAWNVNEQTITLKAGANTLEFRASRAGSFALNLDHIVLSAAGGGNYHFDQDAVTSGPANPPARLVTLRSGTAGVVAYTDAQNFSSNGFRAYGGGVLSGTGVADLDLFPVAANYSVTWKEYYTTAGGKKGVLLRASNGACPYAGGMKQGYLFVASSNSDQTVTLQPYIAGAGGLTPRPSFTSSFTVGANTACWYRASAIGNTLKFECSRDSIHWEGGAATTFADGTYPGGTTQLLWGFGAPDGSWIVDNISCQASYLSASKLELSGFAYLQDAGPSAGQVVTVSGRSMSAPAVVTASPNFELSLLPSSGFGPSLTLSQTADSVPATPVYVRMKAGLPSGSYTGTLSLSTAGAAQVHVSLAGSVKLQKAYTFTADAATTGAANPPAANITVAAGNTATAGVVDYTDAGGATGNRFRAYSGGQRNATGAMDLNLFPADATDYSVTWKQSVGTANTDYKAGVLLRGSGEAGTATTGYVQGLRQGYLFIVYTANGQATKHSEFRVYRSTSATSLNTLVNTSVNSLVPAVGQSIWYRATVSGTALVSLKLEYSTDSLTWTTGATASDASGAFPAGATQLVWGLGTPNYNFFLDDITLNAIKPSGVLSLSADALTGLRYLRDAGPSASQSFTVSGSALPDQVVLQAPEPFEISLNAGSGYGASLTPAQSGGSLPQTPVYVRLKAGLAVNNYEGALTLAYAGIAASPDKAISLGGAVVQPEILVTTPSALNDLGYIAGYPSAERSFTVAATNLSQNLELRAPANFEISLSPGGGYAPALTLAPATGSIASTTIYVRLQPGLTGTAYSGEIALASAGAADQRMTLQGAVQVQALTAVSETALEGFFYNYYAGGTSPEKSFEVWGNPLADAITLTAPAHFEISLSPGSGYTSSIVLAPANGMVAPVTVYARLKAGLAENTYSGNISITSNTAADKQVALGGSVSWSRVYDFSNDVATTAATPGTTPALNMTVGRDNSASGGVVAYSDAAQNTSNRFRAYSGGNRNATGIVDLNLFPSDAADYSVTWKQSTGSVTDYKVGCLLRGSGSVGTATTGYVQGMLNGYVFIVYHAGAARTEFRIYRSTTATSLNTLVNTTVAGYVPAVGQSVWYRASATGTSPVSLKLEYSTDSISWNTGAVATDATAGAFAAGATQLVWGLASPGYDFFMDDITYNKVPKAQAVTFKALAPKRVGDAAITPEATASSGLPVRYSSSDTGVATVVDGTLHLVGQGTATITAVQSGNEDYAPAQATQTLAVLPWKLLVQHLDGDGGQTANNNLRPYLKVVSQDSVPVLLSELTARYWMTTENTGPVMANIDWAKMGAAKVKARYVGLAAPLQGATGYVEYSFDTAAGLLKAGAHSGEIFSKVYHSNWKALNELNDYSYAAHSTFTAHPKVTLYRNGQLIWGVEPAVAGLSAARMGVPEEEGQPDGISLYPNPVNDVLYVRAGSVAPGAVLEIYTLTGVRVHSTRLVRGVHTLSLQGLAAGTYLVQLKNGAAVTTKKLVKQ